MPGEVMTYFHNPTEEDLATVTTEELWTEMKKRFNNCILIFTADGKEKNTVSNQYWFSGSYSEVLGLIKIADLRFKNLITQDFEIDEEDD